VRLAAAALTLSTLVAILASSCASTDPVATPSPSDPPAADGVDGTWDLLAGTHDGVALPMPAGATIDMTLDGTTAGGTAACNSWFGEVAVGERSMSFSGLGQTEMACLDERMDAEAAYLQALSAVAAFDLDGDMLTLLGPDLELTFTRRPPVADAGLVGTAWVLDGYIEGDAVSSAQGDEAMLVFAADGSLTGNTGCRDFGGAWTTDDGGQLVISDVASDGHACADPLLARQDQNVLEVLSGRVMAEVDGDGLTITSPQGTGLMFRAGLISPRRGSCRGAF